MQPRSQVGCRAPLVLRRWLVPTLAGLWLILAGCEAAPEAAAKDATQSGDVAASDAPVDAVVDATDAAMADTDATILADQAGDAAAADTLTDAVAADQTGDAGLPDADAATDSDAPVGDAAIGDSDASDAGAGDAISSDAAGSDTAGNDTSDVCVGLDCPCTVDADCPSGVCAPTQQGLRCGLACPASGCPSGTSCLQPAGGGTAFCAPPAVSQCAPCGTVADCNPKWGAPALCVPSGADGSFCAAVCSTTSDCPEPLVCAKAPGAAASVCLPPDGIQACACSAWAVSTTADTACTAQVGPQLCPGSRTCTSVGSVGACTPSAGKPCVDAVCKGSKDGSLCDDGDGCTANTTCQSGLCKGGKNICECKADADCQGKNDANLCNGSLRCDTLTNTCVLDPTTVIDCASTTVGACEVAVCVPATGQCVPQPAKSGASCDDGDPCTESTCQGGTCTVASNVCACQTSADCKDDSNLCNGKPFCDKSQFPYGCKTNPATVVVCQASADPCLVSQCNPVTGKCGTLPGPDGVPCEDGKACTSGDACTDGVCSAGAITCACTSHADCLAQDDGNLCNGTSFCNFATGKCQLNPATVVSCPSGNDTQCATNRCQPKTGQCVMTPKPTGLLCNDGNPCSANETCEDGVCAATADICECKTTADCPDDGNACNGVLYCEVTTNRCKVNPASVVTCLPGDNACAPVRCDPQSGSCKPTPVVDGVVCDDGEPCSAPGSCVAGSCQNGADICECELDADCAQFENGNLCDGTLFCDKTRKVCAVSPTTVVTCSTANDTACTQTLCVPKTGQCELVNLPTGVQCQDGNPCTVNDFCENGSCITGVLYCLCQSDAECTKYDDGNLCNGVWYCDQSGAEPNCAPLPGSAVSCEQSTAPVCTSMQCAPKTGVCGPVAVAGSCEDGNTCTTSDFCLDATCQPGPILPCNDTNPCTFDLCVSGQGCVHTLTPNAPCNDGEVCTKADRCSPTGVCQGTPTICEDGSECTTDSCQQGVGCVTVPVAGLCDDDDACTVNDTCAAGLCVSVPKDCDDGNVCTLDSCDDGCKYEPAPAGPCDDDDFCTSKDACSEGTCTGTAVQCPDTGNPCTEQVCDALAGCMVVELTTACDDNYPCTQDDTCKGGTCLGVQRDCDPDGAGYGSCNAMNGCVGDGVVDLCDGLDNDGDGIADNPACGQPCFCVAAAHMVCSAVCTNCPDPGDLAIPYLSSGGTVVSCAHQFPAWGLRQTIGQSLQVAGGVVSDPLTGLVWTEQTSGLVTGYTQARDYCDQLTTGGFVDWRMPTLHELLSVYQPGVSGNSFLLPGLANVMAAPHVSATPVGQTQVRMVVDYTTGAIQPGTSVATRVARCVRAGGTTPAKRGSSIGRFVVNADSVSDQVTGLEWVEPIPAALSPAAGLDWNAAVSACAALPVGLGGAWRLPTAQELMSLWLPPTGGAGVLDPQVFPGSAELQQTWFWSSNQSDTLGQLHWQVSSQAHALQSVGNTAPVGVRCVR